MPEKDSSAVSEALPRLELYRAPAGVEARAELRLKLLRRGASALSTTELLSVIHGGRSARATAQRLVRHHGLAGLRMLAPGDIARDVPEVGGLRLAAALELHRRFRQEERDERRRIQRPGEAYAEVRDIRQLRKEHLVGLYLDAQNGLVHKETVSVGSLNTTRTHPREIFYPAIVHGAVAVILAHNHPSGSVEASPEDIEFTHSIQRAAELLGIDLYDHLIVARGGFVSLRESGQL